MPEWISSANFEVDPERRRSVMQRRAAQGPTWLPRLKAGLFVLALLPLARLLAGAMGWVGSLGANPVEFITRSTGTWALVLLCLTLAITPLRQLSSWHWLIRLRRMLGLFAFFYGTLHAIAFLWFEHFFDLAAMAGDVLKRPFIAMGLAAFVLMAPLALTSTDAMMRRLGRAWGRLHRLVYAVAVLAIAHYAWHKAGKNDFSEVGWYAAVVALLLTWRGSGWLRDRRRV